MKPVVAVIAAGGMAAPVGARLVEHGIKVVTSLAGRSQATIDRAKAAGMIDASDAEIAQSEFILAIVPPKEALPLAQRLAPVLRATNSKPVYVDCNAVNPQTAGRIAEVVAETGCPFVDAGIIGGPPRAGYGGPHFYVSGPDAHRVAVLGEHGLSVRVMQRPNGAASALKMSYGGITKGLTAIGTAMVLAAHRGGVADELRHELSESQPALTIYLTRSVPDMFGKAYRWIAEMEEIASFTGSEAEETMYEGIAELYDRLAVDAVTDKAEIGALAEFFGKPKP